MPDHPDFDPTTSCHDRTLDDMWLPFANPVDRAMRDLVWGSTPDEYQQIIDHESQTEADAAFDAWVASLPKVLIEGEAQPVNGCVAPECASSRQLLRSTCAVRSQTTTHIHRDFFFKIYEGLLFANYQGFIFNTGLTINWERGGYRTPQQIDAAFEGFLQRLRKFAEHRNVEPRYYAVFENGNEVGYHSHIHFHFPHYRRKELRAWLDSSLRAADGSAFPTTDRKLSVNKEFRVIGQWKRFRYFMKGLDPKLLPAERRQLGGDVTLNSLMGVECRQTGVIEIKRVRYARQIGAEAQKKARYVLLRTFFAIPENERYGDAEYKRGIVDRRMMEMTKSLDALEDI